MRSALPLPVLLLAAALGAADTGVEITRYGTWLVVSAPTTSAELPKGLAQLQITARFVDAPATDVAEFVRKATGINVVVAPTVTANPPLVNLDVKAMALGNFLNWTGRQTGLRWQLRDGALYLTDRETPGPRAIRIYDVADLTTPPRDHPGPELALNAPAKGGGGAQLLAPVESPRQAPTADDLAEMLQRLLAPKEKE